MKRSENWKHSGYYWQGMRHNDAHRRDTFEAFAKTLHECAAILDKARTRRSRIASYPLCNLTPSPKMLLDAALSK